MTALCSRCKARPRTKSHRWCQPCQKAWQRNWRANGPRPRKGLPAWLAPKAKGKTLAERATMSPEALSAYYRELGRMGGRARMAKMTPRERSDFHKKGARAAAKVVNARMTPEQRSERSRKAGLAAQALRTPAEKADAMSACGKASAAAKTPEQRSAAARHANAVRYA